MRKTFKNSQGFTLMELLVAMTVFLTVIGLSSGIFIQTLRSQRAITSISESMNSATLALEQIAREMRTGFNFENPTVDRISFTDGYGNYVAYLLISSGEDALVFHAIGRCSSFEDLGCDNSSDFDPITSSNVEIDELKFFLNNGPVPLVTMAIDVSIDGSKEKKDASITLQTSVSSRIIYENG